MTEQATGSEIAGYRIESVIGRGGMATVYRAEDTRLGRKVALKLLSSSLAANEQFRQRFIRESRLAASLDHPNIVPIYEAGDADGVLFIAMRYVVGSDMKDLLARDGALDPDRAVRLFAQIGEALDAAHELGLVHRDVKPGNILITQTHEHGDHVSTEHVYLTDFGLTKRTSSLSGGLTGTGHFLGTVDYVAPEQIQGKPVGPAADMYALGCLLYECLTGRVPFRRDDDAAVLWAHLIEPPPPPSVLRADLPASVNAVVSRAMAKFPEERYGSCHEMVRALAEAVRERGSGGPAAPATVGTAGDDGSTVTPDAPLAAGVASAAAGEAGTAAPPEAEAGAAEADAGTEAGTAGAEEPAWSDVASAPAWPTEAGQDWAPEAEEGAWAPEAGQEWAPEAGEEWSGEDESAWSPEEGQEWTEPEGGWGASGEPGTADGPESTDAPDMASWQEQTSVVTAGGTSATTASTDTGSSTKRRSRRWVLPTVAAVVVVAVVAVALLWWLPSRGQDLNRVYRPGNSTVPLSLRYPDGWRVRESQGTEAVIAARPDVSGDVFFGNGADQGWTAMRRLLQSSPGDAVGVYLSSGFSSVNPSSPSFPDAVRQSMPVGTQLLAGQQPVTAGGLHGVELSGVLTAPTGATASLGLVIDVLTTPQGDQVLLAMFAPSSELEAQRALFEKVRASLRVPG